MGPLLVYAASTRSGGFAVCHYVPPWILINTGGALDEDVTPVIPRGNRLFSI